MLQVRIEAFVSVPPCSGGVAVKRLLPEVVAEFGDQVEVSLHTGPGDEEWEGTPSAPPLPLASATWQSSSAWHRARRA